jgi:diguanylate cyclase (GGDEF)-like protein
MAVGRRARGKRDRSDKRRKSDVDGSTGVCMPSRAENRRTAARARRGAARSAAPPLPAAADATARPLEFLAGTDCHVYVGQLTSDGTYRQRFTGPGIEALLGGVLPADADPAQEWTRAVHPDDRARYAQANRPTGHLAPVSVEYRLIGYDKVVRWVLDRRWPWPTASADAVTYDGAVTDVTNLHQTIENLQNELQSVRAANRRLAEERAIAEEAARTDVLTGLFNRRHFTAELTRRLSSCATGRNRGAGLLIIDIDFFKTVNDDHGHAVGDQLLTAFAERLRSATRSCDLIARWGGEEFVVLLPEVSEASVVRRRAEAIRARVAQHPFVINDNPITIEVSIGAAFAYATATDPQQLLAAADEAMYAAKRAGRNQVGLSLDRPELLTLAAPADPAALMTRQVGHRASPAANPVGNEAACKAR